MTTPAGAGEPAPGSLASLEMLHSTDPRTCGPFELLARLGAGGMGVVYLARGARREVIALKRVREEIAYQQDFRMRLTREVDAMKAVRSPYCAELLGANVMHPPQWVAMQYVAGPTVSQYVHTVGKLPPPLARLFAFALAEALSAIHERRIIHRDIKPGNVILGAKGPCVIDLGIASAAELTSLTETGQRIGSLAWMAPEQLQGGHPITSAVDVHAWAETVYFAATGESPYGAGSTSPQAAAWRIEKGDFDLTRLPSEMHDLQPLLADSLSTTPEKRPTAAAIAAALRPDAPIEAVGGQALPGWDPNLAAPWTPRIPGAPLRPAPRRQVPAAAPAPPRPPPVEPRRWPLWVLGGAVVLVAAVLAGALVQRLTAGDASASPDGGSTAGVSQIGVDEIGAFPLSSKGPAATLLSRTKGADGVIKITGQIRRPDAEEYCNRDPGGAVSSQGQTFDQCVTSTLGGVVNYTALAKCLTRQLRPPSIQTGEPSQDWWEDAGASGYWSNVTTNETRKPNNASGGTAMTAQFKAACPEA